MSSASGDSSSRNAFHRRGSKSPLAGRRGRVETEQEEDLADEDSRPPSSTSRVRNPASSQRRPMHRRGSNGAYDEPPASNRSSGSNEEGPHQRRSSMSSLHSRSTSDASVGSVGDHSNNELGGGERTERFSTYSSRSSAAANNRDTRQRDRGDPPQHANSDRDRAGDPATSAAERRAAFLRTREQRERRLLDHTSGGDARSSQSSPTRRATSEISDRLPSKPSSTANRRVGAGMNAEAEGVYSSRSIANREGRPRRGDRGMSDVSPRRGDRGMGDDSPRRGDRSMSDTSPIRVGDDDNPSGYSSRPSSGRERLRRDRSSGDVTIDSQDDNVPTYSSSRTSTADSARDSRPRQNRSTVEVSLPSSERSTESTYSTMRSTAATATGGARDVRNRREESDDATAGFSARSGVGRDGGWTRRERTASAEATSLSHEDEIERIRELRARRLRGERGGTEREEPQIARDRDDIRSGQRPHHATPEMPEGGGESAALGFNRREREYRKGGGTDRERDRGGESSVSPVRVRSQPLVARKERDDAGLVRRDRVANRRGQGRELSPKPSQSSPIQSSYQPSSRRGDEGSMNSGGRGDDTRSDFRRGERDRARERDHLSLPSASQDRGTEASRYGSRRVRRDAPNNDAAVEGPMARRKSLGHLSVDDAGGNAAPSSSRSIGRIDVGGDAPSSSRSIGRGDVGGDASLSSRSIGRGDGGGYAPSSSRSIGRGDGGGDASSSSRSIGRGDGVGDAPSSLRRIGRVGADAPSSSRSIGRVDRSVGHSDRMAASLEGRGARERDRERRLPGQSTTAVTGERPQERRPPGRAKSADGDSLFAMNSSNVQENEGLVDGDLQSKQLQEREQRRLQLREGRGTAGGRSPSRRFVGRSKSGEAITSRLPKAGESDNRDKNEIAGSDGETLFQQGSNSRLSHRAERDSSRSEIKRRSIEVDTISTAEGVPGIRDDTVVAPAAVHASPIELAGVVVEPSIQNAPTDGSCKASRRSDISSRLQQKSSTRMLGDNADHSKGCIRIPDLEFSSDEEDEMNHNEQWSVRVCVVSAVDLPLNIVPNVPLCPVLKFGLVKIPAIGASELDDDDPSKLPGKHVLDTLGDRGISAVPTARVRSTRYKILSKRDNGSVDFHQELRWDRVKHPMQAALCIELCAQAVRTPNNFQESPRALSHHDAGVHQTVEPSRQVSRHASGSDDDIMGPGVGIRAFWRKATNRKAAELEAANAAAMVARMLTTTSLQSNDNVALRPAQTRQNHEMTQDVRLGSLVIPFTSLPLDKATNGNEAARVEKWYQLDRVEDSLINAQQSNSRRKKPSILLEISFSSPEILDHSEDEMEEGDDDVSDSVGGSHVSKLGTKTNISFSRRASVQARNNQNGGHNDQPQEEAKLEDPVLEPGVIDFISVVGARDIGSQKNDDGSSGWVNSTPKCALLEQFPPNDDFHKKRGRKVLPLNLVEWFCFPEGIRLWRGSGPPTHSDLNLKRFSASSPPNVATSVAAFDACLNCTTSLVWFVVASNSDEYGSKLVKTYGTVIRFYVPAPTGIDLTQSDFAEGEEAISSANKQPAKRLWVPMGICLTSNLPIVGIMEAMLLRLCEEFAFKIGGFRGSNIAMKLLDIHKYLAKVVLDFQKPIAGAVNCSIPFLAGDRFLLALPPSTGLPALTHGRSVVSLCRLLGVEGITFMLASVLTECKILIHSNDLADVAMVAEVITALLYPFCWSLPYIPILPVDMLEFVEAPLSYIVGMPSSSLKLIDPRALDDVVVVDLDHGFSLADSRRNGVGSKNPIQLPAATSTNISMAVYRLLRAEVDVEEEFGGKYFAGQSLPRTDQESLAEREFRVTVAIQLAGLLRGYQECTGPVFNRDKFLKNAPALFEEARDTTGPTSSLANRGGPQGESLTNQRVVSPRSKRFLSLLLNTQNFHQLLESIEDDDDQAAFFHEIMATFEDSISESKPPRGSMDSATKADRTLTQLIKSLQKVEDKVPTYRVETGYDHGFDDDSEGDGSEGTGFLGLEDLELIPTSEATADVSSSFTDQFLTRTEDETSQPRRSQGYDDEAVETEQSPWTYQKLFDIVTEAPGEEDPLVKMSEKVKLRDAIGERRYRAWKMTQDQKLVAQEDFRAISEDLNASKQGASLDLTSLVSSATDDTSDILLAASTALRVSTLSPEQQRVLDAKNRDAIRRCLDKANSRNDKRGSRSTSDGTTPDPFVENGRDLIAEAEKSLRNPSAQRFLLSILAQRSRLENQRGGRHLRRQSSTASQSSVSRLEPLAFDCLIRLSCAMLDTCMEYREYEAAYRLLTHTAGFIMVQQDEIEVGEREHHTKQVISMTSRIGLHPIFADLGVWEKVLLLHLQERRSEKTSGGDHTFEQKSRDASEDGDDVEYQAAVATLYEMLGYGIPGEELSRFATRVSEDYGWFGDERGKQLLMLARRISVRREQTDGGAAGDTGDIDMIRHGQDGPETRARYSGKSVESEYASCDWNEIGWCHPAAPTTRTQTRNEASSGDSPSKESDYLKRSPVTALAAFGSSVVVTGGLDGSVFLAHSISSIEETEPSVRGIHLDWGSASRASAGSSSDGEYGVGAVSCLAAASGSGHYGPTKPSGKDVVGRMTEAEIVASMEGSRVVAGTTAGDLRVWSVKDVYSSILLTRKGEESYGEFSASGGSLGGGSAVTRLKFSLRGRALSGHRGGVTCIDVPSHVYRPDSLVTGGADGLIKLWSLRAPTGGRRMNQPAGATETDTTPQQKARGGDALNVLEGHKGRVLCIKTAWHGDRLLSGAADRTIRIWDLSSTSGKCLHTLTGHFGWITKVQYWGPNTVVSASTDRSVALWDARVRSMPLFVLRHHHSPISDLVVGSRTDPLMVSAAADGTLATWDFRSLSETSNVVGMDTKEKNKHCRVVRDPVATMRHGTKALASGSVLLTRGVTRPSKSVLSVGADAVVREWDIATGNLLQETPSGHCDALSSFSSFGKVDTFSPDSDTHNEGTITSSWDGTIRMRRLVRK